jgi:hypothetical protein
MADQAPSSFATSHDLLASTRALTRRVRDAQRGTWFPLALFGLATLASAPFDRYGTARTCSASSATVHVCSVYSKWAFIYWPTVLVLIYVAVAWFYARHSQQRGVGTRVKPYIVVGIVIAVGLTATSVWVATHPSPFGYVLGLHFYPSTSLGTAIYRLVSPAAAIGLALLVLSRIERNAPLLVFTLGYLAIVLFAFPARHSPLVPHPSPWVFVPRLFIEGGVLLLGSLSFAIAERRGSRSAP